MIHTVIVPGVGGSESQHWQSWLERELSLSSRVEQIHWQSPILTEWVKSLLNTVNAIQSDVEIVAHSFGCLVTVWALARYPELESVVKNVTLVAPANPVRFGVKGLYPEGQESYQHDFHQIKIKVPAKFIMSENDPWLSPDAAYALADAWQIPTVNLGQVGHINVASGFGPFPQIFNYILQQPMPDLKQFVLN